MTAALPPHLLLLPKTHNAYILHNHSKPLHNRINTQNPPSTKPSQLTSNLNLNLVTLATGAQILAPPSLEALTLRTLRKQRERERERERESCGKQTLKFSAQEELIQAASLANLEASRGGAERSNGSPPPLCLSPSLPLSLPLSLSPNSLLWLRLQRNHVDWLPHITKIRAPCGNVSHWTTRFISSFITSR
jgi:hypothetical protein